MGKSAPGGADTYQVSLQIKSSRAGEEDSHLSMRLSFPPHVDPAVWSEHPPLPSCSECQSLLCKVCFLNHRLFVDTSHNSQLKNHRCRITDVVSEDDHGHMSGTRGIGRNKHAQGLLGECADEEER